MDFLKRYWLRIVILLVGIGAAWGTVQFQVLANSKKLEKLEEYKENDIKEGARISAQLEIVIQELRYIKQDIRNAHK